METMPGVINIASFLAKEDLEQCIQHLESDSTMDQEWLVEALCRSRDWVQMASMANALMGDGGLWDSGYGIQGSPCGELKPASADG